jgi:hypothetical protein
MRLKLRLALRSECVINGLELGPASGQQAGRVLMFALKTSISGHGFGWCSVRQLSVV